MPKEEVRREVIPIHKSFVEVNSTYLHFEGTNDYTKDKTIVEEILDKAGVKVAPVWGKDWKEVASGIETRDDSGEQQVRIYKRACPARIKFQNYHEYGEYDSCGGYDDYKNSPTSSYYYWVQYESGRKRFIKRALYFVSIFLILYWTFILLLNNLVYNNQAKIEWLMEWQGCEASPWTRAYYLAPLISFIIAAVVSGIIQASYCVKRFPYMRAFIFITVFWFIDIVVLTRQSSLWDFYPTKEYELTAPVFAISITAFVIIKRMKSKVNTRKKKNYFSS